MKGFYAGIFTLLTLLAANTQAALIELVPSSNNLNLGDAVQVDLRIGELNPGEALGVYDLNINYDSSRLSLTSINWGDSLLGNQLDLMGFGSWQESSEAAPGQLNLFELSFDEGDWLNDFQASSFTLFSLIFTSIDSGSALISAQVNSLGDAWGESLSSNSLVQSQLTIAPPVTVPEPSGLLILLGIAAVALLRRRKVGE